MKMISPYNIVMDARQLYDMYSAIQPINGRSDGYNPSQETLELGFDPDWALGGDDGHWDFIEWLANIFQYKYPCEFGHILRGFREASKPNKAAKAYNPWVYFALELFNDEGQPNASGYREDMDMEDAYNCSPEMTAFWQRYAPTKNMSDDAEMWSLKQQYMQE
jgi:hypothetical protein